MSTQSKLMPISYYNAAQEVRLSAYADTIIFEEDNGNRMLRAIRFGGYPEMVRAMSDALYGGAEIEAVVAEETYRFRSQAKHFRRQVSHDGVYAEATLLSLDDEEAAEKSKDKEDANQQTMDLPPRKCTIFCPADDKDRLFAEIDRKTAVPLIPAFRDYLLSELEKRNILKKLTVISVKEKLDAWVLSCLAACGFSLHRNPPAGDLLLRLPFPQRSRTEAQRPVFWCLAGTRSAVSGKPHKPPTRARRRGTRCRSQLHLLYLLRFRHFWLRISGNRVPLTALGFPRSDKLLLQQLFCWNGNLPPAFSGMRRHRRTLPELLGVLGSQVNVAERCHEMKTIFRAGFQQVFERLPRLAVLLCRKFFAVKFRRHFDLLVVFAALPYTGATSCFLVLGGYALGCVRKAVQTVDTGATVRNALSVTAASPVWVHSAPAKSPDRAAPAAYVPAAYNRLPFFRAALLSLPHSGGR